MKTPLREGDVLMKHFEPAGLLKPTLVWMKFVAIANALILQKIGHLPAILNILAVHRAAYELATHVLVRSLPPLLSGSEKRSQKRVPETELGCRQAIYGRLRALRLANRGVCNHYGHFSGT